MRDLVLARIARGSGILDAFRWAELRESEQQGRDLVVPIDRRGVPADRAVAAMGTNVLAPPVGHQASVVVAGRTRRGVYTANEAAQTSSGIVTTGDAARVLPCAHADGVPCDAGPATVWVHRVGLHVGAFDARQFVLRWELAEHRARWEGDGLGGATWIDVGLAEHQLAVVTQVLTSPSVRHILADEVGLGKTIEALMIWSALSTWNTNLRTLVACPRELIPQWCLEIRRRTERSPGARRWEDVPPVYVPLGGRVVDRLDAPNRRGIVVGSHDGLEEIAGRGAPVDLLIVDEAHRLTRGGQDAARKLAKHAMHVLLLTATPRESARRTKGAARARATPFAWALSVVDPKCDDGSDDLAAIERRLEEDLGFVADADGALAIADAPDEALMSRARERAGEIPLTSCATADVRELVRETTLMERVVRTRRQQIAPDQTARRRLVEVPIEYRAEEIAIFAALRELEAEAPVRGTVRRLSSSSWAALAGSNVGLSPVARTKLGVVREARADAKLEALLDLCARLWQEDAQRKIVIRCEYAATLDLVAERLSALLQDGGLRSSSEDERTAWTTGDAEVVGPVARLDGGEDSMIEALVDPNRAGGSMLAHVVAFERHGAGGAVVLVARDVASVGLNLQFAHDLIFYDVPWRLGLAEQWIGRLDRLGQRGREVTVYTFTHPDSPTRQLIDLYDKLKLFDAASRGTAELDVPVSRLISRADSDEIQWHEVVSTAARLLAEQEGDGDGSAVLDLRSPARCTAHVDEREFNARILCAFAASGFSTEDMGSVVELRWPSAQQPDAVELRDVRARLRSSEHKYGKGNPEKLAIMNEWSPVLRLDPSRIRAPRWFRGAAAEFLTPRHPLVAEAFEELAADPTLCAGCFRVPRPTPSWPRGWFAVALSRTFPGGAGAGLGWRSMAMVPSNLGDPDEDEELRRAFAIVEEGLQRACAAAFPPQVLLHGWQIGDPASPGNRELAPDQIAALRGILPRGVRVTPEERVASRFVRELEDIECARPSCDPSHSREMARIAERAVRYVRLVSTTVVQRRATTVAAVGAGDALRGIRDFHQKRLDLAEEFFDKLKSLTGSVDEALTMAVTPRVIAAALIEVL